MVRCVSEIRRVVVMMHKAACTLNPLMIDSALLYSMTNERRKIIQNLEFSILKIEVCLDFMNFMFATYATFCVFLREFSKLNIILTHLSLKKCLFTFNLLDRKNN